MRCCAMLEEYNYKVMEVENGDEAINQFTAHLDEIQLVILDMIMPKWTEPLKLDTF